MNKKLLFFPQLFKSFLREISSFFEFFFYYLKKKLVVFSVNFEKNKNLLVKFFTMKRGRYNRPFLHLTTMGVLLLGVLIAPFLAETYPIFASNASELDLAAAPASNQSVYVGEDVFQTQTTQIRGEVVKYTVEKGDTVSSIAKKFGISEDTIRWANDKTGDSLSIGEELDILPVTGIAHKVSSGESVYTIAKKYDTNPQKIVDWQFNEFANAETFTLVAGQILIVPDGIKPSAQPLYVAKRQVQVVSGPVPVAGGGFTYPLRGGLSQYFSWGHPGIDITAPIGTPIYAAHNGTVTSVSTGTYDGGFGNNVYVSNGAGVVSHYAHLGGVNISAGQAVVGGQTVVGYVGMTGRTTGPHLHFEIRNGGVAVNPLSYVQ